MSERALVPEQRDPAELREAGVHRLSIATPFRIGRVNIYLIEDEPLTLIDAGPHSASNLKEVQAGLQALGHRIEEVQLLLITHQHLDHFGLAHAIAERSRCEVAAIAPLAGYLSAYDEEAERDDLFAADQMLRHGVPPETVASLRALAASFRSWGEGVEVTMPLSDGDVIALRDRRLKALFRPGHSPSDTIFLDEDRAMLYSGDHLIQKISSNAVITRPLGAERWEAKQRPASLLTYIDSLIATRPLPVEIVLAGHGEVFQGHAALIDERMRLYRRRAAKIRRLIAGRALSAHQIALQMWGNVAVSQAYLTASEVLGHLDLLIEEGQALETEAGGVALFEA